VRQRILGVQFMNDTVRIERPLRCRRHEDLGGRTKQDSLGNNVKVRTRAQESKDYYDGTMLEQTVNLEKDSEG
jgi:ribosomal protein L15E